MLSNPTIVGAGGFVNTGYQKDWLEYSEGSLPFP